MLTYAQDRPSPDFLVSIYGTRRSVERNNNARLRVSQFGYSCCFSRSRFLNNGGSMSTLRRPNDIALFSDLFDAQTSSDASASINTFPNIPVALFMPAPSSRQPQVRWQVRNLHHRCGAIAKMPSCTSWSTPAWTRGSNYFWMNDNASLLPNASPPIFVKAIQVRPRMST